ncbi:MAG: TonB-dependent receptor [Gammaproteobacteria bacterium]|nr:TonB-dependent receptor [Gammaproteobacteria bacterium]
MARFGLAALGSLACFTAAYADTAQGAALTELQTVVVSARHLDERRAGIQTQTGASVYTMDSRAIAATPGGDNTLLNQVVLQAPDVTQDSFGQFHVRGEHDGLQYRINGIVLPEGISVFGQALDPRLIRSMSLITGALPAEFGLRTAGIIDITTKNGLEIPGGSLSLYGGSHGTVQPSVDYAGGIGPLSYFVSGDMLRNDLGIESPDGRSNPIHDHTTQYHGFGYLEDVLDDHDRLALMLGSSVGRFQIPDLYGQQPSLGLSVDGQTTFPSQNLNENQREVTQFGAGSWQHSAGRLDLQSSVIARYSSLTFIPDPLGDLLFDGIAQHAFKQNVAYAAQSDAVYRLNALHSLRAGVFLQTDHSVSDASSAVLPTDPSGVPFGDVPTTIQQSGSRTEWIQSLYLQDEWKPWERLTVNYGLRFDRFTAYTSAHQISPRVNAVWTPRPGTAVHAGYSRYLSPPPFELVGAGDVAAFANTSAAPPNTQDGAPRPERANYYDVGLTQRVGSRLRVGVDTYYKQSTDLIDEGQFGAPIILTPFNYRYGKQYGAEFTANYAHEHLQAYVNFAAQRALGKQIESSQFNFSPADLAYIARNFIDLDHEQRLTASGGIAYAVDHTRVSADLLWGSGLRADLALPTGVTTAYGGSGIPNGAHLPYYTQVNLGLSHVFRVENLGPLTARLDLINLFDAVYQIRNGTGIGVGAPQYGARRGVFVGVSQKF